MVILDIFLDWTTKDVFRSSYPHLINAHVYLQGFGQDVRLFLGLVAEVVTDPSKLHTFGSNRVHSVVVALDQLVTVQCVQLSLFYCGLVKNRIYYCTAR